MTTNETITTSKGSYKAAVTFIEKNGYGESEYRVKVTYNNGDNMAFLRSYDTLRDAEMAAKRELNKVNA